MYTVTFFSMATVKNWLNEFQSSSMSVYDEPLPDGPKRVKSIQYSFGRPPFERARDNWYRRHPKIPC